MARTPKGRASANVQKPYSDDKNKGRRTGKTVKEGHRDSDGFEDFEDMWRLNDASPRPAKRVSDASSLKSDAPGPDDDDDDVDMSIDQEEPEPERFLSPPARYIAPIPAPAPSSVLHRGSLSSRLPPSRPTDFDALPLPSPVRRMGPNRANHSHSLSETSDVSRAKIQEKAKARPKPKPVFKPVVSTPDAAPADDDDDEPNVPAPASPARPRKSVKPPSTAKSAVFEDDGPHNDSIVDMSIASPEPSAVVYQATPSPPRAVTPKSRQSHVDQHEEEEEEDDDDDELPVLPRSSLAASKAQAAQLASSSKSRNSVPAPPLSPSPVQPPSPIASPKKKSKTKAPSLPPPESDDSSGPEDFAPFEPADDAMDFGFDGGAGDGGMDDEVPMEVDDDVVQESQSPEPEPEPEDPPPGPDDEEDDEEEEVVPVRKTAKEKGKRKAQVQESSRSRSDRVGLSPVVEEGEEEDGMVEDDIAAGLDAIGDGDPDDDEPTPEPDPDPEDQPRAKKARSTKNPPVRKASRRRGASVVSEDYILREDKENDGVRRSTRKRHKPLEYWRGEKFEFGRSEDGPAPCPVLKEVIRIPKEIPQPLGKKHRRTGRSGSRAPSSRRGASTGAEAYGTGPPPEEGLDDDTPVDGYVKDWTTGQPLKRRLVYTSKQIEIDDANGGMFSFKKVFGDDDFVASGLITFPVGGLKPHKSSKDNTYVWFVHKGAVKAIIHKQEVTVVEGGTFIVPRGNMYEIHNIAERETVLFFAQARKAPLEDDELYRGDGMRMMESMTPTGGGGRRSISSIPAGPGGRPSFSTNMSPMRYPDRYGAGGSGSLSPQRPAPHASGSFSPTKSAGRGRTNAIRVGGR